MRIAIGGFLHESHSFAPRPTTYRDFREPGGLPPLQIGEALIPALRPCSIGTAGAIAVAEAAGVDLVPWPGPSPTPPARCRTKPSSASAA